jgi:glycosyltransferase involved in cell wall biosynthesis
MACRNAESHLVRQLEALARQETNFSWELVFVDNGSTDRSVSIAEGYRDRVRLGIVSASDRPNQAYARRVGAEAARSDLFVFIDADDELAPGYLDAMYAALAEHDFVTSPVDTAALNPAWAQYAHDVPDSTDGGGSYTPQMANGCTIGITRALLESIGGPPEEYDAVWDLALSVRAHLAGAALAWLPGPFVRYRLRDSIGGLFRQTRDWGCYQARAHREFGPRVMPRRSAWVVLREWATAARKLVTARTRGDVAQSAVRFGYCVGRLQGSLRYRTLYP